ncbi:MAG: amidohydrolase [Flavisolibacter sp.]
MSDLSFTLLQTQLQWEDKELNLLNLEKKINDIIAPTQVVVLPEMFPTGFSMKPEVLFETMNGKVIQWMKRIASEKKFILTGSVIIQENGQYFNRLIWMLPNGEFGHYDKRHLFAFGGEDLHFTPGNKRLIASANGWKINLQVCYDLRFPVWSRQQMSDNKEFEYDVLVYVANWPEKRANAWKALLRSRAIENQSYVIGVNRVGLDGNDINYTGDSMVIDPQGNILYHNENREEGYTIRLSKNLLEEARSKFPFWRDADKFSLFL